VLAALLREAVDAVGADSVDSVVAAKRDVALVKELLGEGRRRRPRSRPATSAAACASGRLAAAASRTRSSGASRRSATSSRPSVSKVLFDENTEE
jgi:hypothetical protein